MSYTMTFDVSHKVGRGGHAQAFFRHIARDIDQRAGFRFPQANKNIVEDRTVLNLTAVNDGMGGFRRPKAVDGRPPSSEFDDYLKKRLGTVERALRKDAVLMRGVILQLDPEWFEDHNPHWRRDGISHEASSYMNAALEWACAEFGHQNVVGWSLHLDEVSPQLQLMMTPVTDDGRLSQKDYFKNPAALTKQHVSVRAAMAKAGYDVEHRVTERSREHLSSSEFQAKADWLRDAAHEAESIRSENELVRTRLGRRSSEIDDLERSALQREHDAAERQASAELAVSKALEVERQARFSLEAAERARQEAESERQRLQKINARLEVVPAEVDRWLDKMTTAGGVPLRTRFEADMAKKHAIRREALGLVDGEVRAQSPRRERSGPEF